MSQTDVATEKHRVWMQIIVSLVLLFAGIVILTAPNRFVGELSQDTQKVAAGWVGAVIGYWLS